MGGPNARHYNRPPCGGVRHGGLRRRKAAVQLKQAPGLDKVEANCAACHSLDYVLINSPFPNAKLWDAEINKMIKVFGAPIDEQDAQAIKDYLVKNYGS